MKWRPRHEPARTVPERVVVFRYDRLGDLLVSSPIFAAIRARHPDSHVTLVASPLNAEALRGLPEIDEIVIYDEDWPSRRKLGFLRRLRAARPTTTIVLSPRTAAYGLALLSGARRRGGLLMSYRLLPRLLAPLLLTHSERIDRSAAAPPRHHTTAVLALAARMGLAASSAAPLRVPVDAAARARIAAALARVGPPAPLFVIQLATKPDPAAAAFCGPGLVAFIQAIARRHPSARLAIVGGPAEHALLATLAPLFDQTLGNAPRMRASSVDLPGVLLVSHPSFAEWSALYARADLVITPDCGAVHLAAAHGRPLVVVYASDRLQRALGEFGPWQVPFRAVGTQRESDIPPGVLAAMADLLADAPAAIAGVAAAPAAV
jgi:ADP-heptose:LPS heptosyltransferase